MLTPKQKDMVKKAALNWCNDKRAERGKAPLQKLPKGILGDPQSCPCGKATGLGVGTYSFSDMKADESLDSDWSLPTKVTQFVLAFDGGEFPELIRED